MIHVAIRQACIDVLGEDPFDPEDGERMTRPLAPHRFVPKAGFSWRWCAVCDRKDTDPIHRVDDDPREAA